VGGRVRALILVGALIGVGVLAGSALSQWWEVPGSTATANPVRAVTIPRGRVRVEVLNAGGRANLARSATDALRAVGFDVVYFGNADSFDQATSVVLDRVGSVDGARAVADALGIRNVRSEPDTNLFVDVSVVLGSEWEPAPPPTAASAATASERPWWDPRRYLPGPEPAPPEGERPGGTLVNPTGDGDGQ
jgi:hypothetical protein